MVNCGESLGYADTLSKLLAGRRISFTAAWENILNFLNRLHNRTFSVTLIRFVPTCAPMLLMALKQF